MFEVKIDDTDTYRITPKYCIICDMKTQMAEYSDLPRNNFGFDKLNDEAWQAQCRNIFNHYKSCTTLFTWEP